MPRTRSIAWSQLKLGVVGIIALTLVAVIVAAVGGQAGFFWQRYPIKLQFRTSRASRAAPWSACRGRMWAG